jgi:hypothetical protein
VVAAASDLPWRGVGQPASASSPLPPLSGSPAAAPAQDKKGQKPTVFEMTDYAPSAFKELRNRWEVSDLMYYRSLSKLSGDGAVGDGKSGMLFFFTQDRRYVLKTVKPNEMSVLVDKGMLGGYLRHMLDNPNSLICRFFGLYRFKMGPKGQSREIILVWWVVRGWWQAPRSCLPCLPVCLLACLPN